MVMHRPRMTRGISVAMLDLVSSLLSSVEREVGRSHDAVRRWASSCSVPKKK